MDILVLRGDGDPQRKSLLRNNCDGTFTDVTREPASPPATSTNSAVWSISTMTASRLFVGNERSPNQLFHNNGDGTFTDIAHSRRGPYGVHQGSPADYDNDGYAISYEQPLGRQLALPQQSQSDIYGCHQASRSLGSGQGFATCSSTTTTTDGQTSLRRLCHVGR